MTLRTSGDGEELMPMRVGKHWYHVFVLLIGGMLGGALSEQLLPAHGTAMAAARHVRVLTAEKFELVNADGNKRGVMEVSRDGTGAISLYDASGKSRAELTVSPRGGAAVAFYDSDGNRRVVLGEGLSGRSGLALYDAKGHQLAGLTVANNGETSLTLYDLSGRARAGLGVASNGQPALALFRKLPRQVDSCEVEFNAASKRSW
jgi:hypothetical protein